jgi:hypothetical protein
MSREYDYKCPSCGKGLYVHLEDVSDDVSVEDFLIGDVTMDGMCPYCFTKYSMYVDSFHLDMRTKVKR